MNSSGPGEVVTEAQIEPQDCPLKAFHSWNLFSHFSTKKRLTWNRPWVNVIGADAFVALQIVVFPPDCAVRKILSTTQIDPDHASCL
jgi:hypothetical protein